MHSLNKEGMNWGVLTTKGYEFTLNLLKEFNLQPTLIYGHESGSKINVLKQLIAKNQIIFGFIEDRRATLENVLSNPELASIRCYLASWGYLKPKDKESLPKSIQLLSKEILATPLASWP